MTIEPELLIGLNEKELEALADSTLAPSQQARLDELLERNSENRITRAELAEVDRLLEMVDQLTTLKARAKHTLAQQTGSWVAGIARTWADDLADPRQDIYTLEDGEPVREP